MNTKTFGNRIKNIRKQKNMSVEQLNLLDAVCTAMIEEFKKEKK